jgi:hypothetical protein
MLRFVLQLSIIFHIQKNIKKYQYIFWTASNITAYINNASKTSFTPSKNDTKVRHRYALLSSLIGCRKLTEPLQNPKNFGCEL